ncbi:MAG TPA: NAD-dependent deacylase [Elusimicrobiota bacterium]|nr:NAD-dependent deacylase [Elusimicrobiota bacterium]
MTRSASLIQKARERLSQAASLCVLTGAGISAESGLRTFRDAGGLWEDHAVEQVATPEGFEADPKLVWRFYNARRLAANVATPNPAHLALARLEVGRNHQRNRRPRLAEGNGNGNGNGNGSGHSKPKSPVTILTQNIDGLHQQAGSHSVVELHGSTWKVQCTGCGIVSSDFPIELPILPHCEECGALLRPHVVWFGEPLEEDVLRQAEAAVVGCDVFLVVGTSAVVQPAASYPFMAARRKIPVIEINLEPTAVSAIAEISLIGKAGEILPQLV